MKIMTRFCFLQTQIYLRSPVWGEKIAKPTRLQKDSELFSSPISCFFSVCFAANIMQHFICLLTRWLNIFKQEKKKQPTANKTFFTIFS